MLNIKKLWKIFSFSDSMHFVCTHIWQKNQLAVFDSAFFWTTLKFQKINRNISGQF